MPFDPISFSEALKALRKQPQPTPPTPQPTQTVQVITQPKYIVYQSGDKYCAQNGFTNAVEMCDSDATKVINYALSNLTPGRTWKETVVLRGSFTVSNSIVVYSYTRLVIDGVINHDCSDRYDLIVNYANTSSAPQGATDTDIEIIGGMINGCYPSNNGMGFWSVNNLKVTGVTVSNFSNNGISVGNCNNCDISNNRVSSVGDIGIAVGGSNCIISNNRVSSFGALGIDVSGSNILVSNNTIEGNNEWITGINIEDSSSYIVIDGNSISNTWAGIAMGGDSYITISNNRIFSNSHYGIWVSASSHIIIAGNTVINNDSAGIYIEGSNYGHSSDILVVGNIVGDDRNPPQQQYWIQLYLYKYSRPESINNVLIADNSVFGVTSAEIDVPTYPTSNNFIINNQGFLTEDYGMVVMPIGSTSVTVQTNLSVPIQSVVITPIGQPDGKLWVGIGTDRKTFTIYSDVPTSGDLFIAYYVRGGTFYKIW